MRRRLQPGLFLIVVLFFATGGVPQVESETDPERLRTAFEERYQSARYEEATRIARRRLQLLEASDPPDREGTADALLDLGRALAELSEYDEAEQSVRRALDIRRELHGDVHPSTAEALRQLAWRKARLSDTWAEADSLFQQALAIQRSALGSDHVEVARTLIRVGQLRQLEGRYAESETVSKQALDLCLKHLGEMHLDTAEALMALYLGTTKRDRNEALQYVRQALAIRRTLLGNDHPLVAESLEWLGVSNMWRGDFVRAEALLREALDIERRFFGDTHDAVGGCWGNLALVLDNLLRRDEAAEATLEAIRTSKIVHGPDNPGLLTLYNNLAVHYLNGERFIEGLDAVDQGLAVAQRIGLEDHASRLYLRYQRAAALWRLGRLDEAEVIFRSLIPEFRKKLGESSAGHILRQLAHMARQKGDTQGAIALLKQSTRDFEIERAKTGFGLTRTLALRTGISPYEDLAVIYAETGEPRNAWESMECNRSRNLTDVLQAAGFSSRDTARRDSLRLSVVSALDDLKRARQEGRGEVAAENRLLLAEAALEGLHRELEEKYPGNHFAPSLAAVQAALEPGTAILGWADTGFALSGIGGVGWEERGVLWGYVIRDTGNAIWAPISLKANALKERMKEFKERLLASAGSALGAEMDPALDREAVALGSAYFGPLLDGLDGVERLIVVPSASTSGIPTEALRDADGNLLGDRFSISYSPSATAFAWMVRHRPPAGATERALLVGDPPFRLEHLQLALSLQPADPSVSSLDPATLRDALGANPEALSRLPRLAWSRREVEHVGHAFPAAKALLGPEASESMLRDLARSGHLKDYGVIHVATHALIDKNAPLESALVLSQVKQENPQEERDLDGLLTGTEIVGTWKLDADLVTLSACETGLIRRSFDGATVGFAHSFLASGARCLLLSLWKVDDEATALLMGRFYENWRGTGARRGNGARPMSKALALREAKHWLRTLEDDRGHRRFEHPFYWSAFILVGDSG